MSNAAEAAIISEYLAAFAAALSGPYTASVITGGQVPHVHVVSQISPELWEEIICDFSTDPPGYLTSWGHRLGSAADPAAAAVGLARILHVTDLEALATRSAPYLAAAERAFDN